MEKKQITGATAYKGKTAQQHEDFEVVFGDFLNNVKPKRVLEIGTGSGGFTLFLREKLNEIGLYDTLIHSYDIRPNATWDILNEMNNIVVSDLDLFSNDHSYTLVREDIVSEFIQQDGLTLVLCDGGNKIREFNQLSKFLKYGDIIMCHDYCDTVENFHSKIYEKIWLWREVSDEDIKESISNYSLSPFNKENFDKIVWGCFRKN